MEPVTCALCGRQTEMFAYIGPTPYCDEGDGPSCYEQALLNRSRLARSWGFT